jgi:hypothetical protein
MLNSVLAARQVQCSAEFGKTFACSAALQGSLSKAHACRHAPLSQTTHLIAFSRTFNVFLKGSNARVCARCGSANRVFSAREWGLAEEAGKIRKIAMAKIAKIAIKIIKSWQSWSNREFWARLYKKLQLLKETQAKCLMSGGQYQLIVDL